MGPNHDLNAGIQAVSDSHNLETAYGINLIGNNYWGLCLIRYSQDRPLFRWGERSKKS
jgi:hypothetical protein